MNYSDKVLEFATKAHEGQFRKYGSNLPYISHPIAVAEIVLKNSPPVYADIIYTIAMFHDILEDTNVTEQEMYDFLIEVSVLISYNDGLSDRKDFANRIIHTVKTLSKKKENFDLIEYLNGIKLDYFATIAKLADLTHNMSDLKDQKKLDYYKLIKYYLEH